jgi:uncharacterized protein YbaP (TraB family)
MPPGSYFMPVYKQYTMRKYLSGVMMMLLCLGRIMSQDPTYSLLWEVTGNGLHEPSYLYGTIHLRDPRVFNLGDSVYYAIESSPSFALEMDMDSAQYFVCNAINDQTADTSRESIDIDKIKAGEKNRMKSNKFAHHQEQEIPQNFLDIYLYRLASKARKTIHGLEPYSQHLDQLEKKGEWSKEEEFYYLFHINNLVSLYEKGDLAGIEKMFSPEAIGDSTMKKRNHEMLHNFISLSHEEGLFAAVGSAHLYGENGLVALLKAEGYTLRRMQPGEVRKPLFTRDAIPYDEWQVFHDQSGLYSIRMPGEPCNAVTAEGASLNLYMDPYTNQGYGVGLHLTDININEKSFSTLIQSQFNRKDSKFKKVITKKIKYKGLNATSFLINLDNYSLEYRYLFYKGYAIYILHGQYLETFDPVARDAFFESVELMEPSHSTYTLEDSVGAFKISFPGKPVYQLVKVSEETEVIPRHLHQWLFGEEKNQYLFQYFDLHNPDLFNQEREYILSFMDDAEIVEGATIIKSDTQYLDGYISRSDIIKLTNGTYLGTHVILRGSRVYMALFNSLEEIHWTNPFFRSFALQPFTNPATEVLALNNGEFEINGSAPVLMHADSAYYYYTWQSDKWDYFTFVHSANATIVTIERALLSPYKEYIWSDTLIDELNRNFGYYPDSLVESAHTMAGFPSHRLVENSVGNNTRIIEYFLTGNTVFAVNMVLPLEVAQTDFPESVIKSFSLVHPPSPIEEGSKGKLALRNLQLKDELLRTKSIEALSFVSFDDEDWDQIEKFINTEWPDDTIVGGTRSALINRWIEDKGSGSLPLLKSLARKMTRKDAFINSVLHGLLSFRDEDALIIADSLLHLHPDGFLLANHGILHHYYDSTHLFQEHLPVLMKHFLNPELKDKLASLLLYHAYDSAFSVGSYIVPHTDHLLTEIETDLDSLLEKSEGYLDLYHAFTIINKVELISLAGQINRAHHFMESLLALEEIYINKSLLLLLIGNDLPYEEEALITVLRDTFSAPEFILDATTRNLIHKIPSHLYTEKDISLFDIFSMISDEYYINQVDLIEKIYPFESKPDQYYYAYELHVSDSEDTLLGVSGPFPLEAGNDYHNSGTTYSYTPLTETNYTSLLGELLKED